MAMISEAKLMDVKIEKLRFREKQEPALQNIELEIFPGEFILLTGSSGAGKTVLLNCMAGVIPHYQEALLQGEISFSGETLHRLPEVAGKIGLVTDNPQNQLFCTTVEEDLAFGPCSMLMDIEDIHQRITEALAFVDLSGYEARRPETLSGGEMQRIVLASQLTLDPKILLLDRPADQLDAKGRKEIYQKLHSWCKSQGKTVIIIEEMLEEVLPWADRILLIEGGTLSHDIRGQKWLTAQAVRGKFKQGRLGSTKPRQNTQGVRPKSTALPAVEVQNLNLSYENSGFALKNISLKIAPGEFVALLGENGAGKTTLTKTFNGLLRPQNGRVWVKGLDTREHTIAELSSQVGYLFQNPLMQVCQSSVKDEIAFALKVRKYPKEQLKSKVLQVVRDFGLEEVIDIHPYQLSRGMLQKCALASALVTDPPILVIDEPTSNMDHEEALKTMEFIERYNGQGHTVIMITHNLKFAVDFCQRFIVLKNGSILLDTNRASLPLYGEVFKELGVNLAEIACLGGGKHETFLG